MTSEVLDRIIAEIRDLRLRLARLETSEYIAAAGDADTLDGLHADATGAANAHVVATDAAGSTKLVSLTATGGVNVGTATGAGAGNIKASGVLDIRGRAGAQEFFIPVTSCTGGVPTDSYLGWLMPDGATHKAIGFGSVPRDFISGMTVKAVVVEGSAGVAGNVYLSTFIYHAAAGEVSSQHGVNATAAIALLLTSLVKEIQPLALPDAAVGDRIGILTQRAGAHASDTYQATMYIRGWIVGYTADS